MPILVQLKSDLQSPVIQGVTCLAIEGTPDLP